MTCCKTSFNLCEPVPACIKQLIVKTPVISDDVALRFLDKFGKIYYVTKTTDAGGLAVVQVQDDDSNLLLPLTRDLPLALLNEYAGEFKLFLIDRNNAPIQWTISAIQYDAISFKVANITPIVDDYEIDVTHAEGVLENFNI
jgi:hypothetical protein